MCAGGYSGSLMVNLFALPFCLNITQAGKGNVGNTGMSDVQSDDWVNLVLSLPHSSSALIN